MNSIEPVKFARQYLSQLGSLCAKQRANNGDPEKADSGVPADAVSGDAALWYAPDGKTVSGNPPSISQFERDIKKLEAQNASPRVINSYCGLSLLIAVMSSVNAGAASLAGPMYVAMAGSVGKALTPPDLEKECGRKAYSELVSKSGISQDPSITQRFERVAGKLLDESNLKKSDVSLIVLDSEEVNAHSIPGYLFVTKGMMERFPSDGELALFVGHEIAHAEDKDALEDLGQNTFEELAVSSTLLKSRVKVEGSDKTVGDLRKLLKESIYESSLSSDRENELAADRRGAELLIKAGYEPGDARKAIEAICSIEEATKLRSIRNNVYREKGYYDEDEIKRRLAEQKKFDAHPDVSERLKAVDGAMAQVDRI